MNTEKKSNMSTEDPHLATSVKPPDSMKRYMGRTMLVRLSGNRRVQGVLRGFDGHMNLVLHDAVELKNAQQPTNATEGANHQGEEASSQIGRSLGVCFVRGNMVVNLEQLQA